MRRREFIALLGGAGLSWPPNAAAQQSAKAAKSLGFLTTQAEGDPVAEGRLVVFRRALAEFGWSERTNIEIYFRWGAANYDRMRAHAADLIKLKSDVILANGTPAVKALLAHTRVVPIVFVLVVDPIGDGIVESLARPGGNVTGFTNVVAGVEGKWLEMLKEVAPSVSTVGILGNPETAGTYGVVIRSLEAATRFVAVRVMPAQTRTESDIENMIAKIAGEPGPGLVVLSDSFTLLHRTKITQLAMRYRVPAIYPISVYVKDGGLLSYGVDSHDIYRRSASYIDRILKGEKPGDLPIQQPIKLDLAINRKTATALGLEVPPSLLVRADEVIE